MPLLAALLSHVQEEYQSYHTPGHKQGLGSLAEWRQLLGEMVFQLDLTELPGLDNLHDAEGIIPDHIEVNSSEKTHLLPASCCCIGSFCCNNVIRFLS
jgi:arginine/lysine/ornithine decarboxylase